MDYTRMYVLRQDVSPRSASAREFVFFLLFSAQGSQVSSELCVWEFFSNV